MLCFSLYAIPMAIMSDSVWAADVSLALLALMGFLGGQFVVSFAYCTDLAPPGDSKTVQVLIARMLAMSFAPSFVVAPTVWKYLFQCLGQRLAWTLAAALGILNAVYVWIVLPESRRRQVADGEEHDKTPCRGAGPPQLSRNPLIYFRLLAPSGPAGGNSAHYLRLITGVIFFLYTAKMTIISTITLFAEQQLGWSPGNAGLLLSTWGLSQFLSMLILGLLGKRVSEVFVSWVGLICALLGMLIFFFSTHGWMLFLGMAIGAVSMISLTALTSYGCCLVRTSMNGEVSGLMTTMICLTEMLGPPMFGTLMSAVLGQDAPWYIVNIAFGVGALLVLVAMAFMFRLPALPEAMRQCGRTFDASTLEFFPDES
jgi:DHA1 family tetracycline resistance protein-like MFS transporter